MTKKKWNVYPSWDSALNDHVCMIVKKNGHRIITVCGTPNPTHLIIGLNPGQSNYLQPEDVKANSIHRIHHEEFVGGRFNWQVGHGFLQSISRITKVPEDINHQEDPFRSGRLIGKYLEFLTRFNAAYEDDLFLNLSFCLAFPSA